MLAEDPDLLEDLKKLKRQTKNAQISAQNSLAKITLIKTEEEINQHISTTQSQNNKLIDT